MVTNISGHMEIVPTIMDVLCAPNRSDFIVALDTAIAVIISPS